MPFIKSRRTSGMVSVGKDLTMESVFTDYASGTGSIVVKSLEKSSGVLTYSSATFDQHGDIVHRHKFTSKR